ncbi:MAG: sensor domain-containing protein [Tissierella sp.]|uniref:sensor domain-containing protein n=1 Tax=Tissierella sp. TaxID=41274 RepID=UPI003F996463
MLSGTSILLFIIVITHYFLRKDKEQLNLTESIASNTNDAVVITNKDTEITYVNNAYEKITGYKKAEVLGLKVSNFKSGKHKEEFYKDMWQNINKKGYWTGELWDKRKDGILYPKKLSIFKIKDKFRKDNLKYVGIFTDLTEIKKEQEYSDKLKDYNMDTNLPNENLLVKLINNNINKNKESFYIMNFSIENYNSILLKFKSDHVFINFLINRIKKIVSEDDFIAQTNGTKFVIFLSSIKSKKDMNDFLNDFLHQTNQSFYIENKEIFYEIKAGIVNFPKDGKSPDELIINSYMALDKAIDTKSINYVYYDEYLKKNLQKETEINLLLRRAIENNELYVYYQPQIDSNTGNIVGAEALLRWNNEKYGMISPAIFIPIAERTGQIIEIGYFIIERVFKDYVALKHKLNEEFRFSINISPLQFNDKELIPKLKYYINKYKVDATKIEIEITENLLMEDIITINKKLKELEELGMTIAIDDFGTGFSSLSYIKNLNVDKLKIDRAFIKDYPEKDDGEMADIIANIAHKLNLNVIAEGAETKAQVNYLKTIGCNLVQGYYYSKPLERNEFEDYMSNYVE